MRMLSIVPAAARYRPAKEVEAEAGAVGWLSDGRLLLTLISAQQQHVCAMMEDRLRDRFLRLDADWDPTAGLGLDVATPEASAHLLDTARKTLEATRRSRIDRLLDMAELA